LTITLSIRSDQVSGSTAGRFTTSFNNPPMNPYRLSAMIVDASSP